MINFLLLVLQFVMDFIILAIYMAFFLPFLAFILPPSWLKTAESIPYFEVYFLSLSLLIPTLLSRFSFFQSILVSLQGVHKARGQELEVIEAALNPVLRQAGLRREDFSLYVDNRDELNAYAIGDHHIVVTRPLLTYLPVPKISGILAHELGHLQHHHTRWLLMSYGMNMPLAISNWIYRILVAILCIFQVIPFVGLAISLFVFFFNTLIRLTNALMGLPIHLLTQYNARQNEYEADRYAYEIGYGAELHNALLDITQGGAYEPSGFFARLWSDHPLTQDRLARLRQYVEGGRQ
ncbi:MAG: Peptidase, M48 family [Succiniclasticum sp.]|jgi:heat shock protein HtpX